MFPVVPRGEEPGPTYCSVLFSRNTRVSVLWCKSSSVLQLCARVHTTPRVLPLVYAVSEGEFRLGGFSPGYDFVKHPSPEEVPPIGLNRGRSARYWSSPRSTDVGHSLKGSHMLVLLWSSRPSDASPADFTTFRDMGWDVGRATRPRPVLCVDADGQGSKALDLSSRVPRLEHRSFRLALL